MPNISTANIRNIALLGHSGSGKTSLAEAMMYLTKATDRLGKISEGNTMCDYDPEEIKRGFSVSTAIAPINFKDKIINIIDTPGYLDFIAETRQALRVAGSALIVVNAKAGLEVGAELGWRYAQESNIPKSIFVNHLDEENTDFSKVLMEMRDMFGVSVVPLVVPFRENDKLVCLVDIARKTAFIRENGERKQIDVPAGAQALIDRYREMLDEALAGTSDALMEKFFTGEEFTMEETLTALHDGMVSGDITPVYSGSATTTWGVEHFLEYIAESYPTPLDKKVERGVEGPIEIKETGPASIFVFKTVADPFVGKMSYFKVMSGVLKKDDVLKNLTTGQTEKFAHIYVSKGKRQIEVEEMACGDIGVTTKLVNTNTNDTLSADHDKQYAKITFPEPLLCTAVVPKAKGDEDKISAGIAKLLEEDLSIRYENRAETKQQLLYGLGEQHIDVIVSRLKTRYGTTVELEPEKIAYREAIKKSVKVEGKHKKQSGGKGQYGHVWIEFSPGEEDGLTFTESIFGGSVPKNFHPAVEKGLQECMAKGVLAGFPVASLKANLYDGSYHDVDSSEMAFKLAAALAFKDGLKQANPVILEPVGNLSVTVPDSMMGDIIGDINKRRGKVMGMNPSEFLKGYSVVDAEVPQSEMGNFTITLRASTQGRGSFTYTFDRYAEAPSNVAQKIIEQAKKEQE
ncbi:MAG: elongation factor G [Ruminococcaceae bacterium]|nr:elongation factor G [Oscillospiraceae bacterium]